MPAFGKAVVKPWCATFIVLHPIRPNICTKKSLTNPIISSREDVNNIDDTETCYYGQTTLYINRTHIASRRRGQLILEILVSLDTTGVSIPVQHQLSTTGIPLPTTDAGSFRDLMNQSSQAWINLGKNWQEKAHIARVVKTKVLVQPRDVRYLLICQVPICHL